MSASQDPSRRAPAASRSRAAERVRLEAKLATVEPWQSLQRLRQRKSGKGLMDAIEVSSERDRLERELMDSSEDYRSWVALSGQGKRSGAPTPPAEFKTRVRVKAPAHTIHTSRQTETIVPAAAQTAPTSTPIKPMSTAADTRASANLSGVRRGRHSAEEASVIIIRRAKDGVETRIELLPSGFSADPVSTSQPVSESKHWRKA